MADSVERPRRVLVLSTDPVTERMPGPAIRAWNLAEQLAGTNDVVLGSTVACDRTHPGFAAAALGAIAARRR